MRGTPFATATLFLSGCMSDLPEGAIDAAKTPDGLPPSVEDVCDDYSGSAYGLCTAYCEAMDCDHPDVHANPQACEHVAKNFTKKTGDPLPCPIEEGNGCIEAVDDTYPYVSGGGFDLDVLANDIFNPGDAAVDAINPEVVEEDPVPGQVVAVIGLSIDPISGHIFGQAIVGGPFDLLQFEYTACCDGGICDTATVTISGS